MNFKVSVFFSDGLCPQTADYSLDELPVCQVDKTFFSKTWEEARVDQQGHFRECQMGLL